MTLEELKLIHTVKLDYEKHNLGVAMVYVNEDYTTLQSIIPHPTEGERFEYMQPTESFLSDFQCMIYECAKFIYSELKLAQENHKNK